jgi:hypothetical protein
MLNIFLHLHSAIEAKVLPQGQPLMLKKWTKKGFRGVA